MNAVTRQFKTIFLILFFMIITNIRLLKTKVSQSQVYNSGLLYYVIRQQFSNINHRSQYKCDIQLLISNATQLFHLHIPVPFLLRFPPTPL